MAFPFEKLIVYQRSLEWYQQALILIENGNGRIPASLTDQLTRASLSISANIAEGNGRWHRAEKRNFFWIARGSAFECVPLLAALQIRGAITEKDYDRCYSVLEEIGKMLTRLIQSVEAMEPPAPLRK